MVDYRECEPSRALRPYVRCFWAVRNDVATLAATPSQRVLPDGCMDIILARSGPEDEGRDAFALTAVGAMSRYFDAVPLPLRIGVRFEPGMGPLFLRVPAATLTDLEIPLRELWGRDAHTLLADVVKPPSIAERVHVLERWLLRRLDCAGAVDEPVLAVVRRIVADGGKGAVREVVRGAGLSDRQLRRRFEAAVGVGPKQLARIVRLNEAMRRAALHAGSWAQIAVDAGYYDQSHMIGEFQALAGQTPAQVVGTRA